eukprot:1149810-Pelagomonas_calceolata.AAC.4
MVRCFPCPATLQKQPPHKTCLAHLRKSKRAVCAGGCLGCEIRKQANPCHWRCSGSSPSRLPDQQQVVGHFTRTMLGDLGRRTRESPNWGRVPQGQETQAEHWVHVTGEPAGVKALEHWPR